MRILNSATRRHVGSLTSNPTLRPINYTLSLTTYLPERTITSCPTHYLARSDIDRGPLNSTYNMLDQNIQSTQSETESNHTNATTNDAAEYLAPKDLTKLSPVEMIARITELEKKLKENTAKLAVLTSTSTNASTVDLTPPPSKPKTKPKKPPKYFDFSRYGTRQIALKFAYLGHRYNGLEYANGGLPALKPTVEEALWKGLRKSRLIPLDVPEGCDGSFEVVYDEKIRKKIYWGIGPDDSVHEKVKLEIDWTGLGYSKCGRTDKGVSAFGQVVGVTVRSNRLKCVAQQQPDDAAGELEPLVFDDVKDELPYMSILNSVLPADIKVLAWCPNPGPSFDARFSCTGRKYKYFFTNPAFCPTPGPLGLSHASGERASVREGWLDIEAMRKAAKKLEGLHDYRNFCKLDASKQMSSCTRRITFADIEKTPGGVDLHEFISNPLLNKDGDGGELVNGHGNSNSVPEQPGPEVYAFAVHGSAFLWHQVRCMVAVLFLVGQGLEKPEIVDELLDIVKTPGKPHYEMADDTPLVLWDCVFPGENQLGLNWIYAGDENSVPGLVKKGDSQHDGKFGVSGLVNDLWSEWHEAKMKETLTAGLLGLALSQGDGTSLERSGFRTGANHRTRSQRIFDGGNSAKAVGNYIPMMCKPKMETLEVQNAKYAAGKQARRDLKRSQTPPVE